MVAGCRCFAWTMFGCWLLCALVCWVCTVSFVVSGDVACDCLFCVWFADLWVVLIVFVALILPCFLDFGIFRFASLVVLLFCACCLFRMFRVCCICCADVCCLLLIWLLVLCICFTCNLLYWLMSFCFD